MTVTGPRSSPPSTAADEPRSVVGRRIVAALIDIAVVNAVLFGIISLGTSGPLTLTPAATLLLVAITLAYYFAGEATTGQTLGKHLLDIQVVRTDGRRATPARIAVRTLLRLADNLPEFYALGLAVMLFNERRQRIGDIYADTVVVRRTRRR